jgi:hypothetical protein
MLLLYLYVRVCVCSINEIGTSMMSFSGRRGDVLMTHLLISLSLSYTPPYPQHTTHPHTHTWSFC